MQNFGGDIPRQQCAAAIPIRRPAAAGLALVLSALTLWTLGATSALAVGIQESTPPPVSGRRLSAPETILPADVLARVELLRANVELLRRYTGRPVPPDPRLRAEGARPMEVYSQARNLQRRASRLAMEQVRIVRGDSLPIPGEARPADVFRLIDDALASVLLVKRNFGIEAAVAEQVQPESTIPSEVFNAAIAAGSELNNLLDGQTSPSDAFQLVTAAVHSAASLHVSLPNGSSLPREPDFSPNKTPSDVYLRMHRCFSIIRQLAARRGLEMLSYTLSEEGTRQITPNDVGDLASLIVEEVNRLHSLFPEARTPAPAYYPGTRLPSHVYQRVGLLEVILEDLLAADGAAPATPGGA